MTSIPTDDIESLFCSYIDEHQQLYQDRLAEAVAIPSVSSELEEHLNDIHRMMDWTVNHIERLGGRYELRKNPASTSKRPLPPILMASFSASKDNSNEKMTVCVYGHLDVQPAHINDGWHTDPFVLTEHDGKLYGRGSTDDKGPALSWLWIIEAHQALGIPLPVNVKILYEGMEENGSDGLFATIAMEADQFLADVDFFCISDNYWINKTKPCLTYGLRGVAYFQLSVQGCAQDLHSGVCGGTVHEAMTDLVQMMASLVDSQGKILVPGVYDSVTPLTDEEAALYEPIEFDLQDFQTDNGIITGKLLHDTKESLLMHRWRYPSLSLHGIEGAFGGVGAKTVIPATVIGKFSMRLVPDQDPKHMERLVRTHLMNKFTDLHSPNRIQLELLHGAKAWLSSPRHPNYEAAATAIRKVYGQSPDYTREGGSIPIVSSLEDCTGGTNVLLLPIGACDDMAHSQNEKYNISNMMNGIKVLGLYLHELGKIQGPKPSSCRCTSPPLSTTELMIPGAFVKGFRCLCSI